MNKGGPTFGPELALETGRELALETGRETAPVLVYIVTNSLSPLNTLSQRGTASASMRLGQRGLACPVGVSHKKRRERRKHEGGKLR